MMWNVDTFPDHDIIIIITNIGNNDIILMETQEPNADVIP